MLTQSRLKKVLYYDANTGDFIRLVSTNNSVKVGDIAGSKDVSCGYIKIAVDGKRYLAHRLAWLYEYGEFPDTGLDHINRIRYDNRISNLRLADKVVNGRNCKLNCKNKTGISGVSFHSRDKKYYVTIGLNMKIKHLTVTKDFFEACCARKSAEVKYGYHENHGR